MLDFAKRLRGPWRGNGRDRRKADVAWQIKDALLIEHIETDVRVVHEAGAGARANGAQGIRDISHPSNCGSSVSDRIGDEMQTASDDPA